MTKTTPNKLEKINARTTAHFRNCGFSQTSLGAPFFAYAPSRQRQADETGQKPLLVDDSAVPIKFSLKGGIPWRRTG